MDLPRPSYDRDHVSTGVVHFGVGGFHRAHQALFHDRLMNEGKALDWGICGVGVMPADEKMRDVMREQDGRVHPGREARRRDARRARHRLDHGVHVRARRPRGGDREARRPGDADRLADGDRGRLQPRRRDRRVRRGRPGGGAGPRGRRDAEDGVRARDRGAGAPARARDRALHGDVVRQPPGQRHARPHRLHRVRAAARPGARRLGRARGALPQRHGRPHHAGDARRGHRGGQRALRRRGPLAGRLRAVHPVGARGLLLGRAAAVRGGRRAGRRRRRALRADEAAAAQREPPGDRLLRLPVRLPARARRRAGPAVPGSAGALHGRGGDAHAVAGAGRRPRRLQADADRALLQPRRARHGPAAVRGELRPHPQVAAAGGARAAEVGGRDQALGGDRRELGALRRGRRRGRRADRDRRPPRREADRDRQAPARRARRLHRQPRPVRRPRRRRALRRGLPDRAALTARARRPRDARGARRRTRSRTCRRPSWRRRAAGRAAPRPSRASSRRRAGRP